MKVFLSSSVFLLSALTSAVVGQNCNSCHGCCPNVNSSALCKCDQHCQVFQDCCGGSSPSSTESASFLSNLLFECISAYVDQDFPVIAENEAFLMISTCSSSWTEIEDSAIERNCHEPTQPLPPVTDITTGLVYKNEYCAHCNGVVQLVAWQSRLVCSEVIYDLITSSTLAMAIGRDPDLLNRECNSCSFIPPNITYDSTLAPRSCIPRVETCLPLHQLEIITNKTIDEEDYTSQIRNCQSGPVDLIHSTVSGTVYRNRFCAACNGDGYLQCLDLMNRDLNILNEVCRVPKTTDAPTSEMIAEVFSTTSIHTTAVTTTRPTTENTREGLRPHLRPQARPPPSTPSSKETATDFEDLLPNPPPAQIIPPQFSFIVTLSNLGHGQVAVSSMDKSTSVAVACPEGNVLIGTECRPTQCPEGYSSTGGRCLYVDFDITISSGSFQNISFFNCSSSILISNNESYIDFSNGTLYLIDPGILLEVVEHDDSGHPIICLQNSTLNCSTELVALNESEYTVVSNSSIYYKDRLVKISFYSEDGRPLVCPNIINYTYHNATTVLVDPPGSQILTYIGCSLSVLGALAVLLTYSCFKELQTFPGLVLMNLCVTVIGTSLVFIVGGSVLEYYPLKEICTTLAIVLHFSYLAQFSWMSVFSFETTKNFYQARTLIKGSRQAKYNYFLVYLTVGWLLPLVIIVITVIVNFTKKELILYGEDGDGQMLGCWINHNSSYIVAFLLPLILSLFTNFVFFIITTVLLCRAYKDQNKLKKSNVFTMIRVWLAIFTTTGLTWLFGFFAIIQEVWWMWYLFIIFNSSQGFGIFLTFIFTKKIWNLYKSRITKSFKENVLKRKKTRFTVKSNVESSEEKHSANTHHTLNSIATKQGREIETSTTELITQSTL